MKKYIAYIALISLVLVGIIQIPATQAAPPSCVPLFGLTKPNGRHFYTTNQGEVFQVMQFGYRYDGIVANILPSATAGALPIHRYYNSSKGAHRYFASNNVSESYGAYEGIIGYISQTEGEGTALYYAADDLILDVVFYQGTRNPSGNYSRGGTLGYACGGESYLDKQNTIFRYYNPKSGKHFYTTSKTEGDGAVRNSGFKYEGIAGYVFDSNSAGNSNPIYRLYNSSKNKHFYTTNEDEKQTLTSTGGYRFEGTIGYTAGGYRGLPMHRLYNSKTNDHLWTTDNLEAERAENAGYVKESALGFINPHIN